MAKHVEVFNDKITLAVLSTKLDYVISKVTDIETKQNNTFITRIEFDPINKIVYGVVALILTTVVGAVLALIVMKPG